MSEGVPARARLYARRARVASVGVAFDGGAGVFPGAPAAGEGVDVGVAHLLEVVGRERGAVAAAAVEDELGGVVGEGRLYVALDDAAPHVPGAERVAALPLVVLAHVDEDRAPFHPPARLFDAHLADARARLPDQFEEPFAVIHTLSASPRRFDFRFRSLLHHSASPVRCGVPYA